MGMMDTIVMFQDGADLEPTPTTSSQFLCLEHAQATHKHTEQLPNQIGSISFVDATIRYVYLMVANSYKMQHLNS